MQILPIWFIYVAVAMRIVGGLAYVRATLTSRAKPHAVSWLIWTIAPFITFFAELSSGVGPVAIIPLAIGITPLFVVIAALKTDRKLFKIDRFDAFCISIAVLGLLIWGVTQEPITAIILAITADAISCLPTIRKTIRRPDSEYPPTFLLSASSMAVALLASGEISFAGSAFPIYVLTINLIVAFLALRRPKKKRASRTTHSRKRRATPARAYSKS